MLQRKNKNLLTLLSLFVLTFATIGFSFSAPLYAQDLEGAVDANCSEGTDTENCGITRYIVLAINVLSVLAGIVIAASIAYGGIQYSMSGSDPQKVSAAKDRIRNAIIALIFFIFGYAVLNYLVPGGLL